MGLWALCWGRGVGHAVDVGAEAVTGPAGQAAKQITFTIGVIALSAKMAKADGTVTRDEVDAFKRIFHIPAHEAANVGRVFDQARRDTAGYQEYAAQIARMFKDSPQVLEDLLGALFHIAMADGVFHPKEEEYLQNVSRIFGFGEAKYENIKAQHVQGAAEDPYTILGVARDVSDTELKRAYRKLIKEHHPDQLIAQGMPEEFIEIANEKLAAINTAYDRIAKERGLN